MDYREVRDALTNLGDALGWRARARERETRFDVLCRQVDEIALNVAALCRAYKVRTVRDAQVQDLHRSARVSGERAPATRADVQAVADRLDAALAELRAAVSGGDG